MALICDPPPCTTTGEVPACRSATTSRAKPASSCMASSPYLTTMSWGGARGFRALRGGHGNTATTRARRKSAMLYFFTIPTRKHMPMCPRTCEKVNLVTSTTYSGQRAKSDTNLTVFMLAPSLLPKVTVLSSHPSLLAKQ